MADDTQITSATPVESPEVNDGSQAQAEDFGLPDPIEGDEKLQQAVLSIAKHFMAQDKVGRRLEVINARRQRFYRAQVQYIVWSNAAWGFIPWNGSAADSTNGSPAQDTPRYTDVYDIYWPYMRALCSVGVQNPPGVNFEPDDPGNAVDITSARAAEHFRHFLDRVNQRKALQADIMSLFCTDGRTMIYTRSVKDAQKFGLDDQGQPNCGELMTAHGVLETKVPIVSKSMADWPYAVISDELDWYIAKQTYPQYAAKIKQGGSSSGETTYERFARIGIMQGKQGYQQASDAYAHLSTRHRIWLRPAAFRQAPDDIAEKLLELYPEGMKLIWCGEAYCGSCQQSMDDHLAIGFPGPGDGMSRPSMLNSLVPVQDAYNDYRNMEKEFLDFCIPVTYVASEAGDIEAIREQASEPGNHVSITLPAGIQDISAAIMSPPPPTAPASLIEAYQDLCGAFAQFQTGAMPALFGGSDTDNTTKGGIAMLRDQAMGQFSMAWGAMQELFAQAYKQGTICAAAARDENQELNIQVPGSRGKTLVTSIAIGDLKKGNFHCYPDTDSSFPETTGAKRQTVMGLVTQALTNPLAAEAYGVLEPDNLELQRELLGIGDWVIPAANARDKQMGEIEKLLEQTPVPNPQAILEYAADSAIENAVAQDAEPSGIPVPPAGPPDPMQILKSSIPVDLDWDFHEFEYETVKDWLSSPEGLEEVRTNPAGVMNVKLHGMEHKAAMGAGPGQQPPPPAPAPTPAGKKPMGPQGLPVPQPGPMGAPQAPSPIQ